MNSSSRTLWMGNIDPWMKEEHLIQLFNSFNVYPLNLVIKQKQNKKGCCFVEFENASTAFNVLETLNGVKVQNFTIKLNWVNNKKDYSDFQSKKYTIYVGNLHKKITNEELKSFFKEEFPSVISAKVIYDVNTHESKGFGFIYLLDYQDYLRLLSNKTQKSCRNMRLMINPAKSKREEEMNDNYNSNNNCNNMSSGSTMQSPSLRGQYNKYKKYVSNTLFYMNKNMNRSNSNNEVNSIQIDSFLDSAQNNLPKPFERNCNNDFALKLQKGFQDIVNMYTSSYNKPKVSFQCIYFCNLNVRYDMKTLGDEFQQFFEIFSKKGSG